MRGVASQQSLFSRHRASSVERELARTPYAFTPKPREADEQSDILTQRLVGPDILPGDLETIKKAREQILDPFEDDINVRLAKERIFGGYSRSGSRAESRAHSPTIFPSNTDFERKLKNDNGNFEKILFGPNISFDTNSNYSEKLSDTSSIRTSLVQSENVKAIQPKQKAIQTNVVRPKQSVLKSVQSSGKVLDLGVKTRPSSPVVKDIVARRTSDLSVKDNKSDGSSNSYASSVPLVKSKQVTIQSSFSSERSGSNDSDEVTNKNIAVVNPVIADGTKVKSGAEPAFKVTEFVHLKNNFGDDVYLQSAILNVSEAGIEKYRKSRALAESNVEKFYRSIANNSHGDSKDTGSDEVQRYSDKTVKTKASSREPSRAASKTASRVASRAPSPRSEPFKVLAAPQPPAADLESVSSTVSSFKLPPAVRSHRASAFAILGDAVASTATVPPSESESQTSSGTPAVVPLPPTSTGRVSPFRGRGFKADSVSRHTTPKTSRATSPSKSRPPSPLRSRAGSMSKVEVGPKVDTRNPLVYERSQTPAIDYIKANIEEVKELSEFNRERNQELAEQKLLEEEMEILRELGVKDPVELQKLAKQSLRSRSGSPSGWLYYDNFVPNSRIINKTDGFDILGRRPLKVSPRNVISLPQSKSGSPTHRSRIPKRQNSLTPPMDERDYFKEPSVMTNALSSDGRFISNSTSSIYDNRVFSIITDVDNNPIDVNTAKVRSKSSSNLIPGPSILKTKPPRAPSRTGPPPSHKNLNSKRLSPIVSTPDKSPVPNQSPEEEITLYQAKSFTQLKNKDSPRKSNIETRARTNVYEKTSTKKFDSKSKPGTPKVMSPTRAPKRPSKSLVTSPSTSRTPSRAPSRGTVNRTLGKETSPLKKTPSVSKFSTGPKASYSKTTPREDRMSTRSDSSETEKKYPLKRANSRTSVVSRMGITNSAKPELKRVDSRTSIKPLTRTNSIKSIREKPGAKRRPSMKDVEETTEEPIGKGKASSRSKPKKSTNKKETNTDDIDKQDSETQYDKTSHLDLAMEKLIPLTKTNVVSMTTAAITAQPLEIAAKVTSQLPSALEKARERGVFDRNSSSDSIAVKMAQPNDTLKVEDEKSGDQSKKGDSTTLQKTASKTSIGSIKEEKDTLKPSESIILNDNLKLKPIKTPLDPKVANVKKKIDNILNSSQSSFEDIREKVKKVEKAADKTHQLTQKTEAVDKKVEETAKKADDMIKKVESSVKKAEGTVAKVDDKLGEAISSGAKIIEAKNVMDEVKSVVKESEKDASSILTKKTSEKGLTPIETTMKPETPKPSESKMAASQIEIVKPKEEVIKKETLTPTVTIVNEKARGKMSEEHVTEKIIKGDPDVEVQSGNIPMDKIMMPTSIEDSTSMANGAGTSNGTGKNGLPPETNGSMDGAMESKSAVSMVSANGMDDEAAEENEVEKKKTGCCGGKSIFPCWKSQNLSEVQLIDENIGKKRSSKSEMSQASTKKGDMDEKEGWKSRLICCRGKNKVRDSSLPRHSLAPSDATGRSMSRSTSKPRGRCASIFCCCCNKKDQVDRRDSILSQKPKQKWYKRICCGGKKNTSLQASRRTSMFSKKRSLSQAVPPLQEDKRTKLDNSLIEHTSMLRGAIPALPVPLAWTCLLCNILVPGLGTVLSGMFCLCFGRPRFGIYDGWKPRIGAFLIDLIVGVGQLFTVLFCLVGWGWSIWWATIMIRVARKYKKLKVTTHDPEQAQATTNNHRVNNT